MPTPKSLQLINNKVLNTIIDDGNCEKIIREDFKIEGKMKKLIGKVLMKERRPMRRISRSISKNPS